MFVYKLNFCNVSALVVVVTQTLESRFNEYRLQRSFEIFLNVNNCFFF